ncbi:MAG: right-handed parallel beta-helix repeat-containing protein [Pseudomonadota bacterium]|nr:right-handed parallel beta-helix repeat-containing protein [Pseudomonadota bacterium]
MKYSLPFPSRVLSLGVSLVFTLGALESQAARIDVYSGQELQQAIQAAVAGDEIVLQPGGYESEATSALSGFANAHYFGSANGTAQQPIVLRSSSATNRQVLRGTTNSKKIGLYITGDYWVVKDIVVTNSAKGIVLDNSNNSIIDNVVVHDVGEEAIHLRDNSSNNLVKNSRVYNTGLISPGTGEAFYVGSHPGSSDGKGYVYGAACHNNVIGGNTIGPGIAAEHIDIKEGTQGTIFEFNIMDGIGITGQNSADSFVDIKGQHAVIRGNKAYRNGESRVKNAFETHSDADQNTFIGNQVDLDGSSDYLLFASEGVNHVSSDNIRLDGRSDRIAGHWSAASVDNIIPAGIPAPGNYVTNQTSSSAASSSVASSAAPVSSSSSSIASSSSAAASSINSSGCSNYIDVVWELRTELTVSQSTCVRFDRNLAGKNVQVWDSDTQTSCDYRGSAVSINGSGSLTINSNYVVTTALSGTTIKFTPAAGSSCNYLKIRAY